MEKEKKINSIFYVLLLKQDISIKKQFTLKYIFKEYNKKK